MSSRLFQRPENAISKAEEFIKVGKPTRALDTLYEVIKYKKRTNYSEKILEQVMFKYLELCVELKRSHVAKEGLFQYRLLCQSTNVASLASVVQGYLNLAEKRTESARQESQDSVADIDDLENIATPEMIMLNAVSGEDAQDRSDRTILMPWVKFLWDSYCQCLELLRTNVRVERLYHDIAQQAFRFCLKYQRKTEFRKLCEKLRIHLDLILKQIFPMPSLLISPLVINLNSPETQQMNLDTRLIQLDAAIAMELWQEAYKAVEDIHGFMMVSKKIYQPKMMANYYQKLSLVFWKCGNYLFHAAAVFKHFSLTREMKKSISSEELGRLASRVLVSVLSVPLPSQHPEFDKFIETDRSPQEKMARLSVLLYLSNPPTRASLIKDAYRFGIVSAATSQIQNLYRWLEVDFHPLKLCSRIEGVLEYIRTSEEGLSLTSSSASSSSLSLLQYIGPLTEITLVRLLRQISQVYESICFSRLLTLAAPFADSFSLERIIVEAVRHNDMQIRIDHRRQTIHFGMDYVESQCHDRIEGPHLQDMPSEQIRTQLMVMMEVLDKSLKIISPEQLKNNNEALRSSILESYHLSKANDHYHILQRQKTIEERKEFLEKLNTQKRTEESIKLEALRREQQELEEKRLVKERLEREARRADEEFKLIQLKHLREKVDQIAQTEIGKKVLNKMDEKEIAFLDTDQIMARQVLELEKEKRENSARLKLQEKRNDHFERGKRQEEIPLLLSSFDVDKKTDKEFWERKEAERIESLISERQICVQLSSRLSVLRPDANDFVEKLKMIREEEFAEKDKAFSKRIASEKNLRLSLRREKRKEGRREAWRIETEEKEKARKEALEAQETQRLSRLKEEEYQRKKSELDAAVQKQRAREREIEEKMAASREPLLRNKEGVSSWRDRKEEIGGGGGGSAWKPGGGNWRDREKMKDSEWGAKKEPERIGGDWRDAPPTRRLDDKRPEGGGVIKRDVDGSRDFRREDGGGSRDFRREDGGGSRDFRRDDGGGSRDFRREDGGGPRDFRRPESRDFRRTEPRREIRRDDMQQQQQPLHWRGGSRNSMGTQEDSKKNDDEGWIQVGQGNERK